MRPRSRFLLLIALCGVVSTTSIAQVTTGFTYQGELEQFNAPAQGAFDFSFALYDASVGGPVVFGPATSANVPVNDGLFNTIVDFGADVYGGADLYLEVSVRVGGGSDSFTVLSPRQLLTPSPLALHALNVEEGAIGSLQLADDAVTSTALAAGSVGTAQLSASSVTAAKIAQAAVGTIQADTGQLQVRLAGICEEGTFLRGVNQDGSIVCSAPQPSVPYLLGISGIVSDTQGRAQFGDSLFGTAAVNASCAATYPADAGAHFCTPDELHRAVAAKSFPADTSGFSGVATWTVGNVFNGVNATGTAPPGTSLFATCQNMSGETGDVGKGSTATVTIDNVATGNGGGAVTDVVDIRSGFQCNTARPFLCCR